MKQFLAALALGQAIALSGVAVAEPIRLDSRQMDKVSAGLTIDPFLTSNPTTALLFLGLLGSPLGLLGQTNSNSNTTVSVTTAPGFVSVSASVKSGP